MFVLAVFIPMVNGQQATGWRGEALAACGRTIYPAVLIQRAFSSVTGIVWAAQAAHLAHLAHLARVAHLAQVAQPRYSEPAKRQ